MPQILPSNTFTTAKFIVSATASDGTHTTIASALTSASSGDTIFIRPGTYTENLTLKAGVGLAAFTGDSDTPNVTIIGNSTFTASGSVTISNIRLQTNSANFLTVSGSAASVVNLKSCFLNCSNNTGILLSSSNASSTISITDCTGSIGTTGIAYHTVTGTGSISYLYGNFGNAGASVTASTNSSGSVLLEYCSITSPFSCTSTGSMGLISCIVNTATQNTLALTFNGSGANSLFLSDINAGSASAVSIGAGAILNSYNNIVTSSNTNAITGAGQMFYGGLDFTSTATINTVTQNPIAYSVAQGGTGLTTVGNSQILATNSSGVLASRSLSVTRQIFTSTGTYTPTTGMIYCDIIAIGGGGAGGGAAATGATTVSVGSGGGAGEYSQGTFSASTIGASQTVTIGAAGTANTGATGGNGGTTSVGSTLISANGGAGGVASAAGATVNSANALGGTGGTGGNVRTPGYSGNYGYANAAPVIILTAGVGGNSQYGAGGITSIAGATNQGSAGLGNGSGGGGSSNYINQAATLSGGVGTKGIVIVTEYIIA